MEVHFIMSKLTREQKIEIYNQRKLGKSCKELSLEYRVNVQNIRYLVRFIETHGENGLRNGHNRYYSAKQKEDIINEVLLNHKSIVAVALEYGLSSFGMLSNWIKSYKEDGCAIVEKTKGRKSTMTKKMKPTKDYQNMTPEEKVKYLENKNLYLEAEVEYLKKLRAVVQARKDRQPKKK